MEKITTKSTSLHTALASELILRETTMTRLVFQPMLVDNPSEKEASIKGRFVFQKKGKSEEWEDVKTTGLSQVKKERRPIFHSSLGSCGVCQHSCRIH